MWLSFITSILLALVEEERGRQIQEERRLLGLDPRARQIEMPFGHPSEWIVPVSLYADGAGIYRIIGLPAFWLAEEQIGEEVKMPPYHRDEIEGFLDWSSYDPSHEHRADVDVYVYLEGPGRQYSASMLLVVIHDNNDVSTTPSVVKWSNSKANVRALEFIKRSGWDLDNASDLVRTALVPPKMIEVYKALLADEKRVSWESILNELRGGEKEDRQIGLWVKAYQDIQEQMDLLRSLRADVDFWRDARLGDDEVLERIREMEPDSFLEQIEEEASIDGSSPSFNRFVEAQENGVHILLSDEIDRLSELLSKEASEIDDLLDGCTLVDFKDYYRTGRPRKSWSFQNDWMSSHEQIDVLDLFFDQNDGMPWLKWEEASTNVSPEKSFGIFAELYAAGYVETPEELAQRAGAITWRFPGRLREDWELMDILGQYRPTGTDPTFAFLKIAFDHGLLSEAAREKYEKLLAEWSDPMEMLVHFDLLTP